jgi:hypothetical protein
MASSKRNKSGGRADANSAIAALQSQQHATNIRLTVVLRIPVVTILGFVGRCGAHAANKPAGWVSTVLADARRHGAARRQWPQQAYDAAAWGKQLCAVADCTLVDLRCALFTIVNHCCQMVVLLLHSQGRHLATEGLYLPARSTSICRAMHSIGCKRSCFLQIAAAGDHGNGNAEEQLTDCEAYRVNVCPVAAIMRSMALPLGSCLRGLLAVRWAAHRHFSHRPVLSGNREGNEERPSGND